MNSPRVLLGVSGGIAAYKAAALTSTFVQRGYTVDVIMTAAAERFITPLTFSSLTARPVYTSLWDAPERIPHIRLVREAQVYLVAPATADVVAKLADGIADDLLTTTVLAARIPVLIAPAMNSAMYQNAQTQTNLARLRERGMQIIDPESGFLAEREMGIGRLASEERLIAAVEGALRGRDSALVGKRLLITAGPTREPMDPVRFVSNASTGATGIAIAQEAVSHGAQVTLVLGPTTLQAPADVQVVRVSTALEMRDAAMQGVRNADMIIATAAVSDWRPKDYSEQKRKKSDEDLVVPMVRNPDILAELSSARPDAYVVGFAAETHDHERFAMEKLQQKHLRAIVYNDVSQERGFGLQENALRVLFADGRRIDLGRASKPILAGRLLAALTEDMEKVRHAARH